MRQLIITGNLTKDPEMRHTQEGLAITTITVANNDKKENVIFMTCKLFGKTAENAKQYLKKGSKCLVSGDFSTYEYEKEGVKKYGHELLANKVEFLDNKPKEETRAGSPEEFADTGKPTDDSDLPF